MFDENFSFVSSTSEPYTIDFKQCTSAEISPFTSRCSSPYPSDVSPGQYQRRASRDTRFDYHRAPRHQSITALTAQLESHDLSDRRPSYASEYIEMASPSDSTDQDEGYYEGPDTPATTASDLSTDFDPTLYDLSMATDMSVTSSPRPSLSLEAQALSSYTMRRRQRQALVRLQCFAKRTPDLAMLIEECHPSSLPLASDAIWAATSRSNSTCSITNGRVDKDRRQSTCVRKAPRMRKRISTR